MIPPLVLPAPCIICFSVDNYPLAPCVITLFCFILSTRLSFACPPWLNLDAPAFHTPVSLPVPPPPIFLSPRVHLVPTFYPPSKFYFVTSNWPRAQSPRHIRRRFITQLTTHARSQSCSTRHDGTRKNGVPWMSSRLLRQIEHECRTRYFVNMDDPDRRSQRA